jgi:chromosome segregation ATPase
MANANLSLDEFERQEADARRQHADLEADMTAVEAELAALKAKAESLERAAEDTESQHELDLANCRQEIDGTRESYQSQANLAVAKSKELDERTRFPNCSDGQQAAVAAIAHQPQGC